MKKYLNAFLDIFSDGEDPQEPHYDPAHIGAMIVLVLLGISVLFWLLWALLVFGGGIQSKIVPFIEILITRKTAADFGYIGYPYAMGVFQGWTTNVAALGFLTLLLCILYYVFGRRPGTGKNTPQGVEQENI